MRGGTLSSGLLRARNLGVFTWAELSALYPNGGASLAALSAEARAVVTNVGKLPCVLMPNAAKTYWVPENGIHRIARYGGSLATPVFTAAGSDATFAPPGGAISIPGGLVQPGQGFQISLVSRRRNANSSIYGYLYFGTAGAPPDPAVATVWLSSLNTPAYTNAAIYVSVASATVMTSNSFMGPINTNNAGDTFDFTTNVNFAATMIFTFFFDLSHVSDFGDLTLLDILWCCT